jgi:hypothetical protein
LCRLVKELRKRAGGTLTKVEVENAEKNSLDGEKIYWLEH